jgi:hypothetical protein
MSDINPMDDPVVPTTLEDAFRSKRISPRRKSFVMVNIIP